VLANINPTTTDAWQKLSAHFQQMESAKLKTLFEENANRFAEFSLEAEDILLDFSKNLLNAETIALLHNLADECGLAEGIEAMFAGKPYRLYCNK